MNGDQHWGNPRLATLLAHSSGVPMGMLHITLNESSEFSRKLIHPFVAQGFIHESPECLSLPARTSIDLLFNPTRRVQLRI